MLDGVVNETGGTQEGEVCGNGTVHRPNREGHGGAVRETRGPVRDGATHGKWGEAREGAAHGTGREGGAVAPSTKWAADRGRGMYAAKRSHTERAGKGAMKPRMPRVGMFVAET